MSVNPASLFFQQPACRTCQSRPCEYLRFGNLFSENILLVPNHGFGRDLHGCPLALKSSHEVELCLSTLSHQELVWQLQQIKSSLPPNEQLHFDIASQPDQFDALPELIECMLYLWHNNTFTVVQPPVFISKNEKLYQEFFGRDGLIPGEKPAEENDEEPEEDDNGNPSITNLQWKKGGDVITKAHVGDEVELTADVEDIANGTNVKIDIYEKDTSTEDDYILSRSTVVRDGKICCKWKVIYVEDKDDADSEQEEKEKGYTLPEYVFRIVCSRHEIKTDKSDKLEVRGWIVTRIFNEKNGIPSRNVPYVIYLTDGNKLSGETDDNGFIVETELKKGEYFIAINKPC